MNFLDKSVFNSIKGQVPDNDPFSGNILSRKVLELRGVDILNAVIDYYESEEVPNYPSLMSTLMLYRYLEIYSDKDGSDLEDQLIAILSKKFPDDYDSLKKHLVGLQAMLAAQSFTNLSEA